MGKTEPKLRREQIKSLKRVRNQSQSDSENGNYECQAILDMKIMKGRRYYLIKWKGYDEKDNTWEPVNNVLTMAKDVLQFQNERKEHVREVQDKWQQMFLSRQVMDPLLTNQLKKIERQAKRGQSESLHQLKQVKNKKIRKIQQNEKEYAKSTHIKIKMPIEDQKTEKEEAKLKTRSSYLKNTEKHTPERVPQNESNGFSNVSYAHYSSQILNSVFFQEKKCQLQLTPLKPRVTLEQRDSTAKNQAFSPLSPLVMPSKEPKEEKKEESPIFEPPKLSLLQKEQKPIQREEPKSHNQEAKLEKENGEVEQSEKPKESSFKTSNYFFENAKRNPIYCCNSPIQRSLKRYIYRTKPKSLNVISQKQKPIQVVIPVPLKQKFVEIISQKAEELQSSQNIKKDEFDLIGNQQNHQEMQGSNFLSKEEINLPNENEKEQADNEVNEILANEQIFSEKQQHIQVNVIENDTSRKSQNLQDKAAEQNQYLQADKQQVQEKKSPQDINISNLPQQIDVNKQQSHQIRQNYSLSQGLHSLFDQFNGSQYQKQRKGQFSRIIEDDEDDDSSLKPIHKTKIITKPLKRHLIRQFPKKAKKDKQHQNEISARTTYDLAQLLASSISHKELRIKLLKMESIVNMFKMAECNIFTVIIREEEHLQERYITYDLMREYYPRALLKYLQSIGKINI